MQQVSRDLNDPTLRRGGVTPRCVMWSSRVKLKPQNLLVSILKYALRLPSVPEKKGIILNRLL